MNYDKFEELRINIHKKLNGEDYSNPNSLNLIKGSDSKAIVKLPIKVEVYPSY